MESWRVYFTESETQIKSWRVGEFILLILRHRLRVGEFILLSLRHRLRVGEFILLSLRHRLRVGEFILLILRHRLRVGEFILLSTVTPLKRWGNTAVKWGLYRGVFLSNHKMLSLYDRTEEKERCQLLKVT